MTIKASPEIWAELGSQSYPREGSVSIFFANLATTIPKIANNMGWGDLSDVVSKSSLDNLLVSGMLDSWNGKIAFTVDLSAKLDLKFRRQIVSNLEWSTHR